MSPMRIAHIHNMILNASLYVLQSPTQVELHSWAMRLQAIQLV
jgi:hypothetical protein